MRCPTCGTALSEVTNTKAGRSQNVTRRIRRCFNGHTYKTIEVSAALFSQVGAVPIAKHERGIKERARRWARNMQIVRAVREGKQSNKAIAIEFGLTFQSITYILRQMGAEDLIRKRRKMP